MRLSIKPFLPKTLFARAALILLTPVIVVQLLVSIAFIQRYYDDVTVQLTSAVMRDIGVVLAFSQDSSASDDTALELAARLRINIQQIGAADVPKADSLLWIDLAGRAIVRTLRQNLDGVVAIDLRTKPAQVWIYLAHQGEIIKFDIERRRFTASNPHQLLVLMVFSGMLMTLISFVFMRNQLMPIRRLAAAAAAFGRGQHVPYSARGASEVRAAGLAFLAMRARIERQIESRTLMLSGVSHDLRSPLTRLRLGLALLPENDDTRALQADIKDMERLLDEFLAFARGDAIEDTVLTEPADILHQLLAKIARGAAQGAVIPKLHHVDDCPALLLRPEAIARALENLIGNAQRYGTRIDISLILNDKQALFIVEDDGPSIPKDKRRHAAEPFARLDAARNPNQGGGVGLGLAIAADVARSHGGELSLGDSARLGGLRAELSIARA